MLNTPVIFLIFRRPDLTAQVFEQIRLAQPSKLFVVADGPRNEEEATLCEQTRQIIETVDWKCEVYKNYSEVNLGCRERVSTGISWAFEQVEEAMILEDDCLPHPSFFRFCEELLNYYRNDERIMVISGDNFQNGQQRGPYSYYFSKYNHCWGWATWRRAWQYWSFEPDQWLTFREEGLMKFVSDTSDEERYWTEIFDKVFLEKKPNSWAYPWTFACWSQGGLTVLPNVNLVSNIGFGEGATHTQGKNKDSVVTDLPTQDIWEINHPPFIVRKKQADLYTFYNVFSYDNQRAIKALIFSLNSFYKEIKNIDFYKKVLSLFKVQQSRLPDIDFLTYAIIEKVKSFTMTSDERLFSLINATRYIINKKINGSFVECGVWKGGSMMSVAYTLIQNEVTDRQLYLFDTFEGMSEPTVKDYDISGFLAEKLLQKGKKQDQSSIWCYSPLEEVQNNLSRTRYPMENIFYIKGKVEETIPKTLPEKIALLRLDTDWYESTKHEMEHLFPRLVRGGVLIIDDYGHWQGCRKAIDEYFEQNNISILLNRIDYTGRIGIKI